MPTSRGQPAVVWVPEAPPGLQLVIDTVGRGVGSKDTLISGEVARATIQLLVIKS